MSVNLDINTLNWVKSEIDETLKQARQALEAYVEAPDDESKLRFCLNYIHQVYGTLQMVELYGASMLAEEMEALTKALLENKVNNRDDGFEVLMRGILQLPDYLEHIQTGHDDIPVVLLPILNDMRAARNEALLSENALFSPDMSAAIPRAAPPPEDTDIQILAKKLRHQFHLGLLDWFRDRDVAGGLKRISSVLKQLRSASVDSELSRLLWSAEGILEGLQAENLQTGVAIKLLMGQVDRQIKRVIDQGEQAFNTLPADDLVKNLLYYVAQSESGTPVVDEIKQAFKLQQAMPDAARLEQARAELSAPNAALMGTVSSVLLEDLNQIKDNLDVFVRAEERNIDVLREMSLKLNQMADTLGMLGYGTQRKTVQEQVAVMQSMVDGQRDMDDNSLMNIASAILFIETSLKEPGGQKARPAEGDHHEDRMRDPEFRQLMASVLAEARNELNKVKESVNNFSLSPRNTSLLKDVPPMLDRIRGSLAMLNLERAESLIDSAEGFVRHKILQADKAPNETELDALADAISSIEYYMESLVDSWGDPTAILDVAEESLRLLGALEAHEPSDEQASVMPTDERIDSEDATLIDMPEIEELEISLALDDNDDTETELTALNLDDMITTVLDDDDDTEIDIEAPELDDEDSLVLDSKGLDLADGLSLEGLEPKTDNRFDESTALSDEITLEHEGLEIDFGDALPEAITSDTQEI
ncbi:MAG: Hpt domain-containing protein, partial [Gammaproteobacteria bacterium]